MSRYSETFYCLASLNSARKLYLETNRIDGGTFQQLADADPSPTKKYLEWMCKQYVELGADVASLSDAIALFDKLSAKNLIENKDINSYDWSSLQQLLEEKAEAKSKTELKEEAKVEGAEEVYADDRYQVFHITSEDASILYGKGTKWCISGINDNEFNNYIRHGVTFYFVIDHEEEAKYAVAVYPKGKKEVYNSRGSKVRKQFPFEFDFVSRPHPAVEKMQQGLATSVEDVEEILEFLGVESYTIDPETLEVDVEGDVDLSGKGLSRLPIKFRTVSGYFYCYNNQLTTLEGAPSTVGGSFYCHDNQLTTLEGAPSEVGGNFACNNNQLTTLEGAPSEVGGNFACHYNQLTSLEGAPSIVRGNFYCDNNQLTSLEGAPSTVDGDFDCSNNPQLTSLKGAPSKVGGYFYCFNTSLTSAEGLGKVKGRVVGIPKRLLQKKPRRRASIILSSLNSARKLYLETNRIDDSTFQQLADADPSPTKKYLEWMCKQYVELGADVASLSDAIALFDKLSAKNLIENKDINGYDWSSLQQLLEEKAEAKSKTELKEEAKVEGAEEVYSDDRYQVFYITSEDASILYGKGTKWCISGIHDNNFSKYIRGDVTFYFVIDHEEKEKYAVLVYPSGRKEVYNSRNRKVNKQFPFEFDFVSRPHPTVEKMRQGIATSVEDVEEILEFLGVESYTIDPETLEVDVEGDVDLSASGLSRLPIKFRVVGGDFNCSFNELTTLKGAPSTVRGDFNCSDNQLTTLEGAPSTVRGSFNCHNNQLTTLEGAPSEVGGYFYCFNNQLTTLEGAPSTVDGDFDCDNNPLKSLEGLGRVKGEIVGVPKRLLQTKPRRRASNYTTTFMEDRMDTEAINFILRAAEQARRVEAASSREYTERLKQQLRQITTPQQAAELLTNSMGVVMRAMELVDANPGLSEFQALQMAQEELRQPRVDAPNRRSLPPGGRRKRLPPPVASIRLRIRR